MGNFGGAATYATINAPGRVVAHRDAVQQAGVDAVASRSKFGSVLYGSVKNRVSFTDRDPKHDAGLRSGGLVNERDDRAAIEALHARDEKAAKARDYAALAALWTDDGVMLAPGGPRLRGPELVAQLEAAGSAGSSLEVIEYAFEFEEVEIVGDHAFEWGIVRGTTRDPQTGVEDKRAYKLLRVLRRDEGTWKVHRAIWNELVEGGSP